MKKQIIIDVDETIRSIVPEILDIYHKEVKPSLLFKKTIDDLTSYGLADKLPGFTKKYVNEEFFFRHHAKRIFLNAKPEPGAVEALQDLHRDGYLLTIASHQFKGLENYTCEWLSKPHHIGASTQSFIPYDNLFFTQNKGNLVGDYLIDDHLDNHTPFEGTSIVPDKPWNQHYLVYPFRMKSWEDIRKFIP